MSNIRRYKKPVEALKRLSRKNSTFFVVPVNSNFSELSRKEDKVNSCYSKSTVFDLLSSLAVLRISSNKHIVKNGETILNCSKRLLGERPINFLVKHTMFRHFCGGETSSEVKDEVKNMMQENITPILNYSIEASVNCDSDRIDTKHNLEIVFEQMRTVEDCIDKDKFSPIKPTSLCDMNSLKNLAQLIDTNPNLLLQPVNMPSTPSKSYFLQHIKEQIGEKHWCTELDQGFSNFYDVGINAINLKQRVLIDAECFSLQRSVDFIALKLMQCFNRDQVYFLNTFQCYLKGNGNNLDNFIKNAIESNFLLGVKLVRGAYMHQERAIYEVSPVFDTIEETHESYNQSAYKVLNYLNENQQAAAVFATHNKDSVNLISAAIDSINNLNMDNIYFAQLKGMAESVTSVLHAKKLKILKLVPYGPINDVLPYLLRRAQENNDVLAKTKEERKLIFKELKQRLFIKKC